MDEKLVRLYYQYNSWWKEKGIPSRFRFPYKRKLFYEILRLVNKNQNVILVGPRRVGKTVLLHQFIQYLLESGCNPGNIFYLACDDPSLSVIEHPVHDAVEFLERIVFKKSLRDVKERFYLIFDEIQGIKKWAEYFKKYIDLGYPVSFLASGSSSIKIVKTSRESLVGRAVELTAYPFSFKEFLELRYKEIFEFGRLEPVNIFERKKFETMADFIYSDGLRKIDIIKRGLEDYFVYGGFPEVYTMGVSEAMHYLKNQVIERILFRDIPEVIEIRNPRLFQQILTFISSESANIVNYSNLSSKFASRYETISSYLFYLESAFLINILKKYSRGGLSMAKSWPKIHIQDPALANAMLNLGRDILINHEIMGCW